MSKFNQKKIVLIAVIIICTALVIVGAVILGSGGFSNMRQPSHTEPPITDHTLPSETQPEENDSTESSPQIQNDYISFPYAIAGTDLVIRQVSSYDGLFYEDGSDKMVSNVAAIMVVNQGDTCMEFANIILKREEDQLRFVGSTLEAGATMIVLEADGKLFEETQYTSCTADISVMDKPEMSEDLVRVEEFKQGGLTVTNVSGKDIPCIRIFYKYYMEDIDVYVGGITYTAKVVDLPAGESRNVTPAHYSPGDSKVVMVKTYDTKD